MAIDIKKYEDIDTLRCLNNVKISEIERRARPNVYAYSGFLGATESFKEVLKKDWQTVSGFGLTHIEVARELKEIANKAWYPASRYVLFKADFSGNFFSFSKKLSFKLTVLSLLTSFVALSVMSSTLFFISTGFVMFFGFLTIFKIQILFIRNEIYKGIQEDLFRKDEKEYIGWNRDIHITNLLNFKTVKIGEGVIDYIEKYGFYEGGGSQNSYRIDPQKLISILTGI